MSLRGKEVKRLGDPLPWSLFRFVFPGLYVPIALSNPSLLRGVLFTLIFFAVPWAIDYAHAYGYADEEGITFRRFIRKYRVTWGDVAKVDWSNSIMQRPYVYLTLECPVGFLRTVKFACYRESARLGQAQNPDWVPEILPWIINHMKMNQTFSTPK